MKTKNTRYFNLEHENKLKLLFKSKRKRRRLLTESGGLRMTGPEKVNYMWFYTFLKIKFLHLFSNLQENISFQTPLTCTLHALGFSSLLTHFVSPVRIAHDSDSSRRSHRRRSYRHSQSRGSTLYNNNIRNVFTFCYNYRL